MAIALIISVLVVALGAALAWGPDRTVSGVEVSEIGVIVLALGVAGVFASLLLSRRAASERATDQRAGWFPGEDVWARTPAEVDESIEDDEGRFHARSPHQPPP